MIDRLLALNSCYNESGKVAFFNELLGGNFYVYIYFREINMFVVLQL